MLNRTIGLLLLTTVLAPLAVAKVELPPASTVPGYVSRLLINEVPFPGEGSYRSEADSLRGMESILNVLHARIHHIPAGYRQVHVAGVTSTDIIDIITAGGVRGQVDGFYRDDAGRFTTVARVEKRMQSLVQIANTGEPGRFARMINHAAHLANEYVRSNALPADAFRSLSAVSGVPVTGRGYSWMTADGAFHPGGNFVAIPPGLSGIQGGNRFFTLRAQPR